MKEIRSGKPSINLATPIPERWKEYYRQAISLDGTRPLIGLLGQMEFVSGHFFLENNNSLLKSVYRGFRVVHANTRINKESVLRPRGLWLLVTRNGVNICPF
jgi:hypothetical protein